MIKYPILQKGATIGVTAPSSGVPVELHDVFKLACEQTRQQGYGVVCGDTVWTQNKAKSSPADVRIKEFNEMMESNHIDLVIPPWGGELLIEILEGIDFETMKKKWVLGYSDTSVLLLEITLKTGIATAHGPNLIDLRGQYQDETTAMWQPVLATKTGDTVIQHSSDKYQKKWQHDNPSPCVFHLTEETYWKTTSNQDVKIQGRLLGGCVDVIRHLVGTPYGDVEAFRKNFINGEPIVWYLENCELSTTDLRRSLVQMRLAGWFDQCAGIMFGRSSANHPVNNYLVEDVYNELSTELKIRIVYDIDCGHVPPQITFINGAFAEVQVREGKGTVLQHFRE